MTLIDDGQGTGKKAGVTNENQLKVMSESRSIQHYTSRENENGYQIIGTATLAAGTVVGLHIKNNDPDRFLVVTYIRHQIIGNSGGTAFPNASNYYKVSFGRTYTSGGSSATAINVRNGSGKQANITAYDTNPTLAGTATEIDRWYTKAAGDMNVFNKEGAVIIDTNNTFELSYVGDQTAGTLYTRLSFLMIDKE